MYVPMSKHILGLDIRYEAVSAVLSRNTLKGNRIEAWEHVAISGRQEIETGIISCLKNLSTPSVLARATCIVGFPARRISFRNIKVPFREKKKIRQILPYELEPTLPFSLEDLILDFYETDTAEQTGLLAAAVERSELEACLSVLSSLKIEPKIVTAGDYALALCLNQLNGMPENCLVANLDFHDSTLCLVESGKIRFVRSFSIQSESPARADDLCTEISRTLCADAGNNPNEFRPSSIFLSGAVSAEDTVRQVIARTFEASVTVPDLIHTLRSTEIAAPHKEWDSSRMDNALALTAIEAEGFGGLNFRKGPFAVQKHWIKYKSHIIQSGILLGLIVCISIAGIFFRSLSLQKQIDQLDTRIMEIFRSSFPEVKKIVDPLQQMRIKLEAARKELYYPEQGDISLYRIDLLNDLSRLIPAGLDVDFSRLIIGPDSILITGNTDTFNSVNTIKSRLEQSRRFKDVTISSANIDKSDNRVQFKVRILLNTAAGETEAK